MSFEELNVPKNHIYLFKPHFLPISFRNGYECPEKPRLVL